MAEGNGILIRNIYYMLSYAFRVLRQTNYESIAAESFDNICDLFAQILSRGLSQQLKQGLYREYVPKNESLPMMRGKLNVNGTIKLRLQHKQMLDCEFDELSADNVYNRILKTTAEHLVFSDSVKTDHKNALRRVLKHFDGIGTIKPDTIPWSTLKTGRNNRTYQMLMNICYFVLHDLLQTTTDGKYRMAAFTDDQMAKLYELFILEYYKHHHSELAPSAQTVGWNLDQKPEESMIKLLPEMRTDITLHSGEKTLIIDAKYYSHTLQKSQYGKETFHSGNLYQVFTYVKNMDSKMTGNVSGMLLYAKTAETELEPCEYSIGGNKFYVRTLDLDRDFKEIAQQLEDVAGLIKQSDII